MTKIRPIQLLVGSALLSLFINLTAVSDALAVNDTETAASAGLNDTPATATDFTGIGPSITVNGSIGPGAGLAGSDGDVDFFRISVGAGSQLILSVAGPTTGVLSPSGGTIDVALFDSAGLLLAYDNNDNSPTNPAAINAYNITSSGNYYAVISEWSNRPDILDTGGIYTPLATNGYSVSGVVADATYNNSNGSIQHAGEGYVLTITGAVPEPATIAQCCLAAIGMSLAFARRNSARRS